MNLRRGDSVYVAVKGPYTTKPRPVVVIQATATLELMESVTVCPVTGSRSWIMADKIVTVPRSAVKFPAVGKLDSRELAELEEMRCEIGWISRSAWPSSRTP